MFLHSLIRLTRFVIVISLLSGCNHFGSRYSNSAHNDPYAYTGVEDLLSFGYSMANMSESARSEVCKSLQNTQNISPSVGVQLHLMEGRLLSDSCGDIPKLLDGVTAISPVYLTDENLQRLIALHTQTLTRMQDQSKKMCGTGLRLQKNKTLTESKESREPKKNETRLLREKLEAIRTMEKQLDENNGSH